jgi:hypothetical protein
VRPDKRRARLLGAAVLLALVFRVAVVSAWHKPGGDGVQYFSLANQLRKDGRFAFANTPNKLSYSRLPGYPLFMAYVGSAGKWIGFEPHLRIATIWNIVFDMGTAIFLILILRALNITRRILPAFLLFLWPTLWLVSSYAMTESISTFLTTLALYLAIRLQQTPSFRTAVAAGVVAGLLQLIRFDAVATFPMAIFAALAVRAPWRRRIALAGAYALTAFVVFSPWPIRNLVRFGEPHFAATTWRTTEGEPLATGPVQWARTWASSKAGESFFELYFVYKVPYQIERPKAIPPASVDDDAEKARLKTILNRYNRELLSDGVNSDFLALARDRFHRHPIRTLLWLPFLRVCHLFLPEPEYEMPMNIAWLGLPGIRPIFGIIDMAVFVGALCGAILWLRKRDDKFYVVLMLLPVALRIGIYAFAIPQATTERYLVEVFPFFAVLATLASVSAADRAAKRRDARRAEGPPSAA